MATTAYSGSAPVCAMKPTTPRHRILADFGRVVRTARTLRGLLPTVACDPRLNAAMLEWLATGEALAVLVAALPSNV